MTDMANFLHWLQDYVSGILQWLQKYKAGYFVVVLIAARVTWRVYKSVSSRREEVQRAPVPIQPGQAAFGAVQEIVRRLEADPDTDWSKVNLSGFHQHLIDLDAVTLRAVVKEEPVDGGLRVEISGAARTLAAIRRIVPAHARELNQMPGWDARVETMEDGVVLAVTSTDLRQVAHIRGLGFIGLLASGTADKLGDVVMAKAG
jgi:hypothetical protein